MARARSIFKRMRAVKSTRTITRTMEMISTARFKKTHDRVVAARPYTDGLTHVVGELSAALAGQDISHPLMNANTAAGVQAVIVISANRGLAGSYNSNILRLGMEQLRLAKEAGKEVQLHVVGKRGVQFFRFRQIPVVKTYTQFDFIPQYDQVAALADEFIGLFTEKKISGLTVVHTKYISAGVQKPAADQVLPLKVDDAQAKEVKTSGTRDIYDFVPSPREVLETLLPAAVRLRLFQAFLDAAVSEQISRMTSMRAATENADEMIHLLTIRYNRMRQSQITTELAEIMGGRANLES